MGSIVEADSRKQLAVLLIIAQVIVSGCLDPFRPQVIQNDVNYLVVGGYLNGPGGITTIHLGRTEAIDAGASLEPESSAIVQIVGDDGSSYPLAETSQGVYTGSNLAPDPGRNFQLKIKTASNHEYTSEWVPYRDAPPIDTVRWEVADGNVNLYATAHDPTKNTRYYLWTFHETWSYHSAYYSYIKVVKGQVVPRDPSDDIYHCWKTLPNTQILAASSDKLTLDLISDFELTSIPLTSEKFQFEYSTLIEQRAVTKAEYDYWKELKRNTEQIGNLFGPQPSVVTGNIHSVTTADEPVIGYFGAGSSQQKRIFIMNDELPTTSHETGYENCKMDTVSIKASADFGGSSYLIMEAFKGLELVGYLTSDAYCINCTYHGGTTVKPDFWK